MSVVSAACITTAVCLSITIFALQTKIDFTMCNGLIFVFCMVFILFGFTIMIVYVTMPLTYLQAQILQYVYGGIAALLFSLVITTQVLWLLMMTDFLVYDTQMVVGGRKHELSPEEYIYGALQLYLDVVYIFLIVLSLFGSKD